jgi:hypothetical protein
MTVSVDEDNNKPISSACLSIANSVSESECEQLCICVERGKFECTRSAKHSLEECEKYIIIIIINSCSPLRSIDLQQSSANALCEKYNC